MNRIIGEIVGKEKGPLLIFIGGMHGNEGPGISALEHVFDRLKTRSSKAKGKAIAVKGNLTAISVNERYIHFDLNRIWDKHHFNTIDKLEVAEYRELKALKEIIEEELKGDYTCCYLIDLHTTSAPTIPFLVTAYDNHDQSFINKLKVPYITGLAGFLDGTMLSWFCRKGHCGLAFEAGQHHSRSSIIKHEAFIELAMFHSGFYPDLKPTQVEWLQNILDDELKPRHSHFNLVERYHIDADENFKMSPGFTNFQKIYKGEVLANNKYGDILASMDGNIFMPLYQTQGDDGFFIIVPANN